MRSLVQMVAVLGLMAAIAALPHTALAAVRSCQPVLTGVERTAATEQTGKRLALESWVESARKGYGPQYAGWQIAISKTLSCRRGPAGGAGGKDSRGAEFICQARAAPCTVLQVPPPSSGPSPLAPAPVRRSKAMEI